MKKFFKNLCFGAAALCMGFSAVACDTQSTVDANAESAYLTIDINPSVEMVIENGLIASVKACNEDGAVLLSGESFEGKTVEKATNEIVALAEELGYLTSSNADVKIVALADDEELTLKIEKAAKAGAEKGSEKAKVNANPRSADQRKVKELREENEELFKKLTPAKLRLIEAIMQYDPEMTYDIGVAMKVDELAEMLKGLVDEIGEIVGDELEKKFGTRLEELKAKKDEEIAKIYGEEYFTAWEKYSALKQQYEDLKKAAENAFLSKEDLAAVLEILNLPSVEEVFQDAQVNVEMLENYIDEYLDGLFGEGGLNEQMKEIIQSAVDAILEKYDEDEYALTAENLASISELLGEDVAFESLEELEEFIKAQEKVLEELLGEIRLTDEQKAKIKEIREEMKELKEQVKDELHKDIEEMKNSFRDKKAQKRK